MDNERNQGQSYRRIIPRKVWRFAYVAALATQTSGAQPALYDAIEWMKDYSQSQISSECGPALQYGDDQIDAGNTVKGIQILTQTVVHDFVGDKEWCEAVIHKPDVEIRGTVEFKKESYVLTSTYGSDKVTSYFLPESYVVDDEFSRNLGLVEGRPFLTINAIDTNGRKVQIMSSEDIALIPESERIVGLVRLTEQERSLGEDGIDYAMINTQQMENYLDVSHNPDITLLGIKDYQPFFANGGDLQIDTAHSALPLLYFQWTGKGTPATGLPSKAYNALLGHYTFAEETAVDDKQVLADTDRPLVVLLAQTQTGEVNIITVPTYTLANNDAYSATIDILKSEGIETFWILDLDYSRIYFLPQQHLYPVVRQQTAPGNHYRIVEHYQQPPAILQSPQTYGDSFWNSLAPGDAGMYLVYTEPAEGDITIEEKVETYSHTVQNEVKTISEPKYFYEFTSHLRLDSAPRLIGGYVLDSDMASEIIRSMFLQYAAEDHQYLDNEYVYLVQRTKNSERESYYVQVLTQTGINEYSQVLSASIRKDSTGTTLSVLDNNKSVQWSILLQDVDIVTGVVSQTPDFAQSLIDLYNTTRDETVLPYVYTQPPVLSYLTDVEVSAMTTDVHWQYYPIFDMSSEDLRQIIANLSGINLEYLSNADEYALYISADSKDNPSQYSIRIIRAGSNGLHELTGTISIKADWYQFITSDTSSFTVSSDGYVADRVQLSAPTLRDMFLIAEQTYLSAAS